MAELKTKPTQESVNDFLETIEDAQKKADAKFILKLMTEISGDEPKMWGPSIIGFVDEHLKYASGRELDWFKIGFSPRKNALTLYVLRGSKEVYGDLFKSLGKYTTGKGCLYIKKLSDVNTDVLKQIIQKSLAVNY